MREVKNKTKNGRRGEYEQQSARGNARFRSSFSNDFMKEKERLFSVTFPSKNIHHPQTIIMLRRSAVTFAERASQQQQNENVETGNDRAEERMGAFFFISFLFFPLLLLLER